MSIIYISKSKWQRNIVQQCARYCQYEESDFCFNAGSRPCLSLATLSGSGRAIWYKMSSGGFNLSLIKDMRVDLQSYLIFLFYFICHLIYSFDFLAFKSLTSLTLQYLDVSPLKVFDDTIDHIQWCLQTAPQKGWKCGTIKTLSLPRSPPLACFDPPWPSWEQTIADSPQSHNSYFVTLFTLSRLHHIAFTIPIMSKFVAGPSRPAGHQRKTGEQSCLITF